jgi:methylenetetrahydrofolate reductase (NADPH)
MSDAKTKPEVLAEAPGPKPCSGAATTSRKICDLIAGAEADPNCPMPPVAFEYFPPRSEAGEANLYARFGRMAKHKPLYMDMTWGAGGGTSDLTLELCINAKEKYGMEPNMHLTCTNMDEAKIKAGLEGAKAAGICNIVALRGDPPHGQDKWEVTEGGFACALDLVKHMREHYGDYFCISVAGYPEGHPEVIKKVGEGTELSASEAKRVTYLEDGQYVCSDADYAKEIAYLKEKVDAGADLIITQMFFDVGVYTQFVADCRAAGIKVPVVPGIMMLSKYGGFSRMTTMCKTRVPPELKEKVESMKEDADAIKAFGIELATDISKQLLEAGAPILHYYSLNTDSPTVPVLEALGRANPPEPTPAAAPTTTSTTITHPDGTTITVTSTTS